LTPRKRGSVRNIRPLWRQALIQNGGGLGVWGSSNSGSPWTLCGFLALHVRQKEADRAFGEAEASAIQQVDKTKAQLYRVVSEGNISVVDLRKQEVVATIDTLKNKGLSPNSLVLLSEWNSLAGH